jgi:hypothetical protein
VVVVATVGLLRWLNEETPCWPRLPLAASVRAVLLLAGAAALFGRNQEIFQSTAPHVLLQQRDDGNRPSTPQQAAAAVAKTARVWATTMKMAPMAPW